MKINTMLGFLLTSLALSPAVDAGASRSATPPSAPTLSLTGPGLVRWLAGTWNVAIHYQADDIQPGGEGQGVDVMTLAADGPSLTSEFKGSSPLGDFTGQASFGWDGWAHKYASSWSDSLVAGSVFLSGYLQGNQVTLVGDDYERNSQEEVQAVISDIKRDSFTYTVYSRRPGSAGYTPAVIMNYTRQ